jgi:hypothetical protein
LLASLYWLFGLLAGFPGSWQFPFTATFAVGRWFHLLVLSIGGDRVFSTLQGGSIFRFQPLALSPLFSPPGPSISGPIRFRRKHNP